MRARKALRLGRAQWGNESGVQLNSEGSLQEGYTHRKPQGTAGLHNDAVNAQQRSIHDTNQLTNGKRRFDLGRFSRVHQFPYAVNLGIVDWYRDGADAYDRTDAGR